MDGWDMSGLETMTYNRSWDGFAFGGPDTGRYGGWIQVYPSGKQFWPLDPRIEDVRLEDIAHHLSMQCRFSGGVSRFYSVAEHSVRVAELLLSMGESAEVALWGLIHDASEAYMVDFPRPIKHSPGFEAYLEAEERLMRVIARWAKLPLGQPEVVESADRRLLATERRDLLVKGCLWQVPDVIPMTGSLKTVSPHADSPGYWRHRYAGMFAMLTDLMLVDRG